jgi:hypothetical protein
MMVVEPCAERYDGGSLPASRRGWRFNARSGWDRSSRLVATRRLRGLGQAPGKLGREPLRRLGVGLALT